MKRNNEDDNNNKISTVLVAKAIDFCEKLFFVFLILKLAGKLNWGWTWVFSPIWIPICLVCAGIVIGVFYLIIANAMKDEDREDN